MSANDKSILVFQSDFTYAEGAVSSMYGVVKSVDRELEIFDDTHQIPRFDTWSASYRLYQSGLFWPKGTIYVSVVDPGVGTARRACVAKTQSGHIVVTPDNGSLTHLVRHVGIVEVREIDEEKNRLKSTRGTAVFHGRDLFGYTAARLASGVISWDEIGPEYPVDEILLHDIAEPEAGQGKASGIIDIVDPNFGNAWTNIPFDVFEQAGFSYGDMLKVRIYHNGDEFYSQKLPFCRTFGEVDKGEALVYTNELMNIALAVSQGSFIKQAHTGFGPHWTISFTKVQI